MTELALVFYLCEYIKTVASTRQYNSCQSFQTHVSLIPISLYNTNAHTLCVKQVDCKYRASSDLIYSVQLLVGMSVFFKV